MEREKFGSRLGFILVSAGCAIGIGNVWKFPYMCGQFGGAAFILIYLLFLLVMGIPILVCEFSVGRNSQLSISVAFDKTEPEGTKWHRLKWFGIIGNYLLMMFYTTVAGWMMYYCYRSIKGEFVNVTPEQVGNAFSDMLGSAPTMAFWTVLVCIIGFTVCAMGLKGGIEKASKFMMTALFLIMVVLAVRSVFLDGAGAGVKFYLVPDFAKMKEVGVGNVIFGAMSQAFFTLSIGIGSMHIFGSYIGKDRSLTGEAITITALDTTVALLAGFIIIPSCFAFGVEPDAGPSLIFITIPNIFTQMDGGRIFGAFFFLFLTFAAFTTVVAVFENIMSFNMDMLGWSRKKTAWVCMILMSVLSMPCVLGFNILSGIQLIGEGSSILDFEDFIVSNNLLPLGSIGYILYCTRRNGWGWDNFMKEVNTGKGIKFPSAMRPYVAYVLPLVIVAVYLKGYYDMFSPKGTTMLVGWMIVAFALLGFVVFTALGKPKKENK